MVECPQLQKSSANGEGLTSILGRLTLSIVEVGGHSDHGIFDSLAQEGLSCVLHLCQNHGTDLFRREGLHAKHILGRQWSAGKRWRGQLP